ncbi:MAG TPA: GDSL-type esterase/lipase family protein [Solirubrobacteraceae bacterium]|jgi:lysophospholipase L1-like esterase|nr:GDSL-type esterase/lipase family protein [Solirubrobacteraceae bacterium]
MSSLDVRGRGLVAIGDSITRGAGEAMLGLRMQSWALWLAEALELPYTCLARDGARAADALATQVPRLRGPYDLGCVYLGVNDVRSPDFEPAAFADALREVLAAVAESCSALLLIALPRAIGVPPAPASAIATANEEIARRVQEHGAALVQLGPLAGPELVYPDRVHLTARGEAHIALSACAALRPTGMRADERDLQRALEPLTPGARARWLLGGRVPHLARDLRRRARERTGPPLGETG